MRVAGNLDRPARIGYTVGCGFDMIVFFIQTLGCRSAMPSLPGFPWEVGPPPG
jgi:hypothetical protein